MIVKFPQSGVPLQILFDTVNVPVADHHIKFKRTVTLTDRQTNRQTGKCMYRECCVTTAMRCTSSCSETSGLLDCLLPLNADRHRSQFRRRPYAHTDTQTRRHGHM